MEYFVSADRKAYHDWQIELLVESFKNHSVAPKLFIGTNKSIYNRYGFLDNCNNHQNIYLYDDLGKKRGFEPLNELYQLLWLLVSKKLKNSIMVIKPHMILKKYDDIISASDSRAFLYASDPLFTFDCALQKCGQFYKNMKNNKEFYQEKWFNLGNAFIMHGIPDWFVQKVVQTAEELITNQIMEKNDKIGRAHV